jgi:antirestriction protein
MEQIEEMLSESAEPIAEEWEIHDYSAPQNCPDLSRMSLSDISELSQAIAGADEPVALLAYADLMGGDISDALGRFDEAWAGEWNNREEFAYQMAEDMGWLEQSGNGDGIPAVYFDVDAFARDLFLGDYSDVPSNCGIYVFRDF